MLPGYISLFKLCVNRELPAVAFVCSQLDLNASWIAHSFIAHLVAGSQCLQEVDLTLSCGRAAGRATVLPGQLFYLRNFFYLQNFFTRTFFYSRKYFTCATILYT